MKNSSWICLLAFFSGVALVVGYKIVVDDDKSFGSSAPSTSLASPTAVHSTATTKPIGTSAQTSTQAEKKATSAETQPQVEAANRFAGQKSEKTAAILGSNYELLVQQTLADTNNERGPLWLGQLTDAIRQQPTNAALWLAKVTVMERENRLAESVDLLQSAMAHFPPDQRIAQRALVELLVRRSSLLRRLARHQEANSDYARAGSVLCQRRGYLSRDPQDGPEILDLSPFYNAELFSRLGVPGDTSTAAAIREQVLRKTGVEFDLRAAVQVAGTESLKWSPVPPRVVTSIPVNRRCLRLHFLHGTSWDTAGARIKIGAYVLKFANGNSKEFPIVYGDHIRADWWWNDPHPTRRAVLAWTGQKETKQFKGPVRIYHTTWDNPEPEIMVTELAFISAMTKSSLYLIAITVEPYAQD